MSYPFPPIERKVYPKTFLKDVHIIFRFAAINRTTELDAAVEIFFRESFLLDGILISSLEKGMKVFSKDEQIIFFFGADFVELSIKQPEYVSYDHISPYRELLRNYLQTLKVGELKKLVMYKYNQLEYQANDEKQVKDVICDVLNSELMSDVGDVLDNYTRWEKTTHFSDDDSQSQFTIEYGFRKDAQNPKNGALTMKTQIESMEDSITSTNVEEKMELFNHILDNGFHWCVVPEIINRMKEV